MRCICESIDFGSFSILILNGSSVCHDSQCHVRFKSTVLTDERCCSETCRHVLKRNGQRSQRKGSHKNSEFYDHKSSATTQRKL